MTKNQFWKGSTFFVLFSFDLTLLPVQPVQIVSYQGFSTQPNFSYPDIRRPFAIKDQVRPKASEKDNYRNTDWPPTSPKCEHIPHQHEIVAPQVEDDACQ